MRLTEVTDMITVGFVGSMSHLFSDVGVPLLRGVNVSPNRLDLTEMRFISDATHKKWSKSALRAGDVVMVRVGYPGTASTIPEELGTANAASLVVVRPSPTRLDSHYLSLVVNSAFGRKQIAGHLVGGAQQVLNIATAAKLLLPLPPIDEQARIAGALSDAGALIESLEQLLAKKRHLKQGATQELLTGKKRLPGFTEPWSPKRLGELTHMASGGTPLSANSTFYGGDFPWVSISDMTRAGKTISQTERRLSGAGLAASAAKVLPAGTVLYAMYASLGECSIAAVPMATSQAILGIRVGGQIAHEFLYYTLASRKAAVERLGQQGTQSNLNKAIVQAFEVRLPSMAEQRDIATCLGDMDSEIAALEAKLTKAHQIKQGMMQELLTGRIRLV